jgi:carbon monoxide dehydrogenase subunit G
MRLEGSFSVPSHPSNVWRVLTDPNKLSRAIPDLKRLELRDPQSFYAEFKLKVGLLSGTMNMLFRYTDLQEPGRLTVTGRGSGMQSTVDLKIDLDVSEENGGSLVKWTADVTVGGAAASIGARVIEDLAKTKVRELIINLRRIVSAR